MMDWKFSANAGFFGLRRDRFTQYQPYRTLEEKFELIAQVEGIEGIEVKYPADFEDIRLLKQLLDKYELRPSAVNVDIKDAAYFRYGALSERLMKHASSPLDCCGKVWMPLAIWARNW